MGRMCLWHAPGLLNGLPVGRGCVRLGAGFSMVARPSPPPPSLSLPQRGEV